MKKLFMLAAVFCTCFITVAQEAATKPGVIGSDVEGNLVRETVWARSGKGAVPEFKDATATFTSDDDKESQGLVTTITLNQSEAKPIIFSAESKAENISVKQKADYAFYLDITYTDNTRRFGVVAIFKSGSHDWEKAQARFNPDKPIKDISANLLCRYLTGTASFRNAFVTEVK